MGKLQYCRRRYWNCWVTQTRVRVERSYNLAGKTIVEDKVVREWDQAKTPYERLVESSVLSSEHQARLQQLYEHTNPAQLRKAIYRLLDALWEMATALPGSAA